MCVIYTIAISIIIPYLIVYITLIASAILDLLKPIPALPTASILNDASTLVTCLRVDADTYMCTNA